MRRSLVAAAPGVLAATIVMAQFCAVAIAQPAAGSFPVAPLAQRTTVRVALNPQNLFVLPILYGIDKGYFERAGLNVEIVKYPGPSVTVAPMLARGDVDIAPQSPAPAFFNLVTSGFGAKAVATFTTPSKGRTDGAWLSVQKSKVNEIKELKDLKGRVVETAAIGSTGSVMAYAAFKEAGLVVGRDVTTASKVRALGDFLALAKADAQDVTGIPEPMATQMEAEGYHVRWKSMAEVAPWYQNSIMASSEAFARAQPVALRKFLAVYLLAVREINASEGAWTDTTMRLITGWTGITPEVIRKMGAVPFVDPNSLVSLESLSRAEAIWLEVGVLKQKTPLDGLVDPAPLADALKEIGQVN